MYISMNWIGDFVDLSGLDLEALIHRFTLSTAEVEDIYHKGDDLRDVVAGKILSMENHPTSKKLHLLKVDAGNKIYDVVCGAPNAREGIIVPFVKEGGMVSGQEITCATIAGFESHGMCCSEKELGISDDHSGLMELPADTPIGVDMTELYAIRDTVFEVDNKSLTNRPDLWGHYGIAREFAALTGRELKPLETVSLEAYDNLPPIQIDVQDDLCFRYTGLKVRNIQKKVSPVDMRIRLYYCGSRGINLLADLTNYLMLEMGQPMHAFDCAKVDQIEVKRFDKPFSFTTLDGQERQVDENTLMICCKGEPVAIAGIMGGLDSEIADDTDSLLLESANFDAVSVRKSSTRLGLRTDASMRYEKTLDPEMCPTAIGRFLKLLLDIDPDAQVISRLTDVYRTRYPQISLCFDKAYVDRYTGIEIGNDQILQTLRALGFGADYDGQEFHVEVPSWRATKDVTIKADIIEEITRIYGYDNFQITTTHSALAPEKRSAGNKADNFAKDMLVERYHLHEVHSYIWFDAKKCKDLGLSVEENVKLLSPQSPDLETLRTNMGPTLLAFVNENKSFAPDFGLFEIGRVCEGLKEDGMCNERKKLGIALYSRTRSEKELYLELLEILTALGRNIKRAEFTFAHAAPKHQWQHPRNTAVVCYNGQELGWLCTLHPAVLSKLDKKGAAVCAQLDMDAFAAIPATDIAYREPSRFPGIDIDLSLVLPEGITYGQLAPAWAEFDQDTLTGVTLIDSFQQKGFSSITLRFAFSSPERTLSKEEVQPWVDSILQKLAPLGVTLRS
ncbi:MAG TPA: phenylalanine--tRNA ligase subunit beta [Candidatus Acutalibacter pullicola]|uniref:Phenylalanine--tRNA ligase beta subunit n=1 Tax=Candidatus Acutalibacter pullicola TaxID=2838417 RepID=A0A9D2MUY7_9FIRM|nr:phenylalanine--tRNA ligase subunit beta [Candidatus Acutalibacter pullicola]